MSSYNLKYPFIPGEDKQESESKTYSPYKYSSEFKDVQGIIDEEFQSEFDGFPKRLEN